MRTSAELPGVSEGDKMYPSLTTYLPFAARRSSTRRTMRRTTHFWERSYGTFLRSLRLPYSVNTDKSGQTLPMACSR